MAGLTEDIILEILLRLPVKSLIRFKCVCKLWHSLISDPEFAKRQLNRASSKDNYFDYRRLLISIYKTGGGVDTVSPSIRGQVLGYCKGFVCMTWESNSSVYSRVRDSAVVDERFLWFNPFRFRVMGSCNGLICMVSGFNTFRLLNPSTKEEKTLPYPGEVHHGRVFYGYLLYGFGYDSSTDDYKLVRGSYAYAKSTTEVFSLKANSWKTIQEYPTHRCPRDSNVMVNGALHWAGERGHGDNGVLVGAAIVSFDLKEEKFVEVPLPDGISFGSFFTLGVLGGDLSMIQGDFDNSHQVWRMKEYGVRNSWTKLIKLPPSPRAIMIPFDYTRDGDIALLLNDRELAIYNSTTEALEGVDLVVPQSKHWFNVYLYLETLISPNIYS